MLDNFRVWFSEIEREAVENKKRKHKTKVVPKHGRKKYGETRKKTQQLKRNFAIRARILVINHARRMFREPESGFTISLGGRWTQKEGSSEL